MPGPISDSYDPEFGTAANASEIHEAINAVRKQIDLILGEGRKDILDVVRGDDGPATAFAWTPRELRIVRFCLYRAMESICWALLSMADVALEQQIAPAKSAR